MEPIRASREREGEPGRPSAAERASEYAGPSVDGGVAGGSDSPHVPASLAISLALDDHGVLTVKAPREPNDRYTAALLVDSRGKVWFLRHGGAPDPTCAKGCGPLELHASILDLRQGLITAVVILDERPLSDEGLKDWLTHTTAEELAGSLVEARAQGVAQIMR